MAALDDLVTFVKSGVQNVGALVEVMRAAFPQQTGTSTSATTSGSNTLPSNPVGFINVTLQNGTDVRVPYYNP